MIKQFVAFAALLGIAASRSVSSYHKKDYPVDETLFKFGYEFEVDFGYGFHFKGMTPSIFSLGIQGWKYGINAYSTIATTLHFEILDAYQFSSKFDLIPFYIIPFEF